MHLINGDCFQVLKTIEDESIDLVLTDPPYFLSNGGTTCKSGKTDSVNKGDWDSIENFSDQVEHTKIWISQVKRILKSDGAIVVSGTMHNIFIVGYVLQEIGFHILNNITWEKTNPPPNLGCRCFTHSTETIIWAAKSKKSKHRYNYQEMKLENDGKQLKDVWRSSTISKHEKANGSHPTQKPLWLMERLINATTLKGDLVLDPFMGSGTTGVACLNLGRNFIGIEKDINYFNVAKLRTNEKEINND